MTLAEFIGGLALELYRRGEQFASSEVRVFAIEVWPVVGRDPRPAFWADAFLASVRNGKRRDRLAS
jgi:hypothetical protein